MQEIDALLNGAPGDTVALTLVRDIHTMDVSLTFKAFKAERSQAVR